MQHPTISLSELEATLTRLDAKLDARDVHALYLGGLTSTALGFGPQRLLGIILGEKPSLGSAKDADAVLGVLFGYWNTLVALREGEGRVLLGGEDVGTANSEEQLLTFAERKRDDLLWYVRGIDAGGDDPLEWGKTGQDLLEKLAQARAIFDAYVMLLGKHEPGPASELEAARDLLVRTSSSCDRLIADLMNVTDRVRMEALATSVAMEGQTTNDGVRMGGAGVRVPSIGRNSPCPCGSGKRWKRCCGGAQAVH